MFQDWQNWVALAIVAVAAAHVLWRLIRWWRKPEQSGCGSACGGCKSAEKPLVTLDLPRTLAK